MRMLLPLTLGAAGLVAACQPEAKPQTTLVSEPRVQPAGRFAMHVDPAARSARIEMLGHEVATAKRGVHVSAPFANDGMTGSGAPGTFEAVTTNPELPGEGSCGASENCFDVQINNFANRDLFELIMRIDGTFPATGHDPVNPDMLPPGAGISAGLGVFSFGDVPAGGSSAIEDVRLTSVGVAPYTVFGSFFELATGQLPASDDFLSDALSLGFTYNHCGNNFTEVFVCSNGFISFDGLGGCPFAGQTLPDIATPNNWVGLWMDLDPSSAGVWRTYTGGAPGSQTFTLEWIGVPSFGTMSPNNLSITLREATQDARLDIGNVNTLSTFNSGGTQGFENADGSVGVAEVGRNNVDFTASNESFIYSCP